MFQEWTAIGNAGADAELRYTPSGVEVASFSLAVNKEWTGQDGQKQSKTLWARITVWGKMAEPVAKYVTKGKQVLVKGEIEEPRAYTDKNGEMRASLEIRATLVKFLGNRQDVPADATAQGAALAAEKNGGAEIDEDSVPF